MHSTSEVGSMLLIMRCTDPKGKTMNSTPTLNYPTIYHTILPYYTIIYFLRFPFSDKAMAMGVIQFAIGLFGNVPCPIIYGAVVDSACLVWETICDKAGACSLYDGDTFRHFFLGKCTT